MNWFTCVSNGTNHQYYRCYNHSSIYNIETTKRLRRKISIFHVEWQAFELFFFKSKWSKAKECRCHLNAFCISSHENKRYSGHRIVISFKMCREIFWKINCFNNSASVLVLRLARWFYGKCENYVVIKQLRPRFRFRFRLFMLVILNWKWVISCKRCSWNSFKLYDMMTASYVISSIHLRIHMGWLLPIN